MPAGRLKPERGLSIEIFRAVLGNSVEKNNPDCSNYFRCPHCRQEFYLPKTTTESFWKCEFCGHQSYDDEVKDEKCPECGHEL
jgi:primosomal protein N'